MKLIHIIASPFLKLLTTTLHENPRPSFSEILKEWQ